MTGAAIPTSSVTVWLPVALKPVTQRFPEASILRPWEK